MLSTVANRLINTNSLLSQTVSFTAMTVFLLMLNGCILDDGKSYTGRTWEPEKIAKSRTKYTGQVSKISMGNIRPTIPGKSKKHLDKKFDIKIHYQVENKQPENLTNNSPQCVDLFSSNECLVITVRAERADENGAKKLIKKSKDLLLDSFNMSVYNRNNEIKIRPSLCGNTKKGKRVPHYIESHSMPDERFCASFRRSIYEYELNFTRTCEESSNDITILNHPIPLSIKENCINCETEVTAEKVLATPFTVGADLLFNLPIVIMMVW